MSSEPVKPSIPPIGVISVGAMKTTVFAGGRFNPPSKGHDRLIRLVHDVAQRMAAEHCIGVVCGRVSGTDPLAAQSKLGHLRRLWPDANFVLQQSESPDFDAQFIELARQGTEHLVMVVGADRETTFRNRLRQINGNGPGKLVNFKLVSLVVDPRITDEKGEITVSSSRARVCALAGDLAGFRAMLPDHIAEDHARSLFDEVRAGLALAGTRT